MGYDLDFKDIKSKVTIEQVALWLGLPLQKDGATLRCACPIHGGGPRALVVTPGLVNKDGSIGAFWCHANGCKKGGDMIELVAKVMKIRVRDAAQAIRNQFVNGGGTGAAHNGNGKGIESVAEYLVQEHELLQGLDLSVEFLKSLSGTDAAGKPYAVGYKPKGPLSGYLALPIVSKDGSLVAYIGRAIKPGQQFLSFVKEFKAGEHLFGLQRKPEGELKVTDDPLKALAAMQLGFSAVSFLGNPTPPGMRVLAEWMEKHEIVAYEWM